MYEEAQSEAMPEFNAYGQRGPTNNAGRLDSTSRMEALCKVSMSIADDVAVIANRLEMMLSRVDGPRPTSPDARADKAPPPCGYIGALNDSFNQTRNGLDAIRNMISELESIL